MEKLLDLDRILALQTNVDPLQQLGFDASRSRVPKEWAKKKIWLLPTEEVAINDPRFSNLPKVKIYDGKATMPPFESLFTFDILNYPDDFAWEYYEYAIALMKQCNVRNNKKLALFIMMAIK